MAIQQALAYTVGPTLIEVRVHPSDCNVELTNWGKAVSAFNSRKPLVSFYIFVFIIIIILFF